MWHVRPVSYSDTQGMMCLRFSQNIQSLRTITAQTINTSVINTMLVMSTQVKVSDHYSTNVTRIKLNCRSVAISVETTNAWQSPAVARH